MHLRHVKKDALDWSQGGIHSSLHRIQGQCQRLWILSKCLGRVAVDIPGELIQEDDQSQNATWRSFPGFRVALVYLDEFVFEPAARLIDFIIFIEPNSMFGLRYLIVCLQITKPEMEDIFDDLHRIFL